MSIESKALTEENRAVRYDAIVIGAGVAGLYALYRLRERGMRVLLLEAGKGVGGVWWWNRYPGARLDSESYTYAYSFSPELLAEWRWSEHFAGQAELQRYFAHVAERFGLNDDIRFSSPVSVAHYREMDNCWEVRTAKGDTFQSRFVIAAVGPLNAPTFPRIPGRESFAGETCHTSRWPEGVTFDGKRVAVIGTGATGVQITQEAAKSAASLTVFQRTPNYCAPLNNAPIADDEWADIQHRYGEIIRTCRSNNSWFIHDADRRSLFDLSEEDREAFLEALYAEKGIGIWKANFHDIAADPRANEIVSEFMRRKIRERVKDPVTAEKLMPKTYGFGTRRVPLETNYYEVFNKDNVRLVDLNDDPISEITETSIVTAKETFEVDMIVYATGFDAVTGSFDRIDIEGIDGAKLKKKWEDGPQTFLGVHASGFPNFFMPGGPLGSSGNFTPALEYSVDWIIAMIDHMRDNGYDRVDVTSEAERGWTNFVRSGQKNLLMSDVKSWFTGVNTNIDGRDKPRVVVYVGGAAAYRQRCEQVRESNYQEFDFRAGMTPGSSEASGKARLIYSA